MIKAKFQLDSLRIFRHGVTKGLEAKPSRTYLKTRHVADIMDVLDGDIAVVGGCSAAVRVCLGSDSRRRRHFLGNNFGA